ncbi:hypothetical protein ACM01_29345 [Streptomyces viridochromogenes]|uniref:Gfo/Idh/MocA-like oxidoreductase N-terminal domain-containing protein n=1 Tax=Streptomyces viridochromogenes TaxID=1938 RepID=A0A0J7Z4B8_STRVR|nr:hypothetical protein [Streptomyces viridochromogenes]KMS70931.1 hypothetical protein ACM01_29345 [Streptomyces viridochromogenes]KOG13332.1 hypothetical protein ADK35_32820 [Streptomyces viridochromogenes]KOG13436.1 hypothetical protein ADK36_33060 [Streptomyces viridochromogenes]
MSEVTPINVLLVGGCGHWAAKENHIPALLQMKEEGTPVRVGAICDPRNPYREGIDAAGMEPLSTLLRLDSPKWLNPAGMDSDAVHREIDALHAEEPFDAIIIACDPVHHMVYLRWAAGRGVSALCDKPIVCAENASWDPASALRIETDYEDLLRMIAKQDKAFHIAVPLRRRANDAYLKVAGEIQDVYDKHKQGVTSINLVKNAGMYRFPSEYNLGNAHGYRAGVGSLAFSSYHFIDVLAWYLSVAPGKATQLSLTMPYLRRLGEYLKTDEAVMLGSLLGEEGIADAPVELPPEVLRTEVDFVFHAELLDEDDTKLGLITYSCFNNTYSHRATGLSELDSTDLVPFREKGRMSQFVMDINQGNLQHLVMRKNDVVGEDYEIAIQRRRNPRISDEPRQDWLFANAHAGSQITPQDLTRGFLRLAVRQEVPEEIRRQMSFLHEQRLSHHLFSGFYQLIARNFVDSTPARHTVRLT